MCSTPQAPPEHALPPTSLMWDGRPYQMPPPWKLVDLGDRHLAVVPRRRVEWWVYLMAAITLEFFVVWGAVIWRFGDEKAQGVLWPVFGIVLGLAASAFLVAFRSQQLRAMAGEPDVICEFDARGGVRLTARGRQLLPSNEITVRIQYVEDYAPGKSVGRRTEPWTKGPISYAEVNLVVTSQGGEERIGLIGAFLSIPSYCRRAAKRLADVSGLPLDIMNNVFERPEVVNSEWGRNVRRS